MKRFPILALSLGTLLAVMAAPARSAEPSEDRAITVTSSCEVVTPVALRPLLLEHATVTFFVTVDEGGALVDYLATEATHHGLLDAAERAVEKLSFQPAIAHGKPVQASTNVTLSFYDPAQRALHSGMQVTPMRSTTSDIAQRRIYENTRDNSVYRRCEPRELDQPLTVSAARLISLTDAAGMPAKGDAVVEFYVDRHGRARAPRIVEAANDTVALSALVTVRESRYAAPTRHNLPTYVGVRMPLHFVAEPAAAAPAAP